jgi:hypothetical protein
MFRSCEALAVSLTYLNLTNSRVADLTGNNYQLQHTLFDLTQGVTKRCRLSLLTIRALVYESRCGGDGGGGVLGLSQ